MGRYAVVTGGNKGIGLEICRQLASNGITVVLTARDEKRGIQALENLINGGVSNDDVIFHQLDVMDPTSISSLVHFITTQFGRLDILVNNAGIPGAIIDEDAFRAKLGDKSVPGANIDWSGIVTETYEEADRCIQTNYYGAKRMTEAFIPLLQLSDSPRVVNVSSSMGKLKNVPNEWGKGVLSDAENLTEERVDEVLNEFVKDLKDGTKNWASFLGAYAVSKAAMNGYTRIMAKKYPNIIINCVCPGYVKTDINLNTGMLSVEEGAESPVRLALLPDGCPSGLFYVRKELADF